MSIGQNIQTTRTTAKLTQAQLAEAVGVSRQTVAKWEAGETSPDLEHAAILAQVLDTTIDALATLDCRGIDLAAPPRGRHLFGSVKVSERGQVVIPKEARDLFDIRPGDRLVVLGEDGQGLAMCKESVFMANIEAVIAAAHQEAQ